MRQKRLLDLFCGAGGAAMGYYLAGFEIVGVDIKPQPHYPFEFYQADALEFVVEHGAEFDAIHASPPCQAYSWCTPVPYRARHPDLIAIVRVLLEETGKPFVIENVPGARHLLREPVMLCGTMFNLPLWRHRYFEIWPRLSTPIQLRCNHTTLPVLVSGTTRRKVGGRFEYSIAEKREAMQIPWMTTRELDQAIPPVYTEWIGKRILEELESGLGLSL